MEATPTLLPSAFPPDVAYRWMVDFVGDMVAPFEKRTAETLSLALHGKGTIRRFKDMLHLHDEHWL
jgi:hypothetical protein